MYAATPRKNANAARVGLREALGLPSPSLLSSLFPSKKFFSCLSPSKKIFSSFFPPKKKYTATHTIAGSTKRAATGATRCSAFGADKPLSKKKVANEPHGNANP